MLVVMGEKRLGANVIAVVFCIHISFKRTHFFLGPLANRSHGDFISEVLNTEVCELRRI